MRPSLVRETPETDDVFSTAVLLSDQVPSGDRSFRSPNALAADWQAPCRFARRQWALRRHIQTNNISSVFYLHADGEQCGLQQARRESVQGPLTSFSLMVSCN